jgi:heat shock protein HtpX
MTTSNTLKTVVLLGLLTALLVWGGQAAGGRNGLYLGLALAGVMNFVSYFWSEKIALAMSTAASVPSSNGCATAWNCPCRGCG